MFYFDCEIDVVWGVDQVDWVIILLNVCGGVGNCDIVFFFEFYVIYGCFIFIVVNFVYFMDLICVIQDLFIKGCFI